MNKLYYYLIVVPIFFLCSCMSTTYVQVMKPAQVNITPEIETVALVNRAQPQNEKTNTIEGIVTGEGIGQDRQGIEQALMGFQNTLQESQRFEVKRTNLELVGSGSGGTFPSPLSWSEVERICEEYNVDAVAAIETYDSDFIITNGIVTKEKGIGFYAEGVATVKLGFRMYHPKARTIVDQDHLTCNRRWKANSSSVLAAASQLINRKDAIHKASYLAGNNYAARIAPTWFTVSREYFKKGKRNPHFEMGVRSAHISNWEVAKENWHKVIPTAKAKTAGKAAYNLALAYEVQGDLDEALAWATKAYSLYNNKKARPYVSLLERRIWEQEQLDIQLAREGY